jgi:hypothetical protein
MENLSNLFQHRRLGIYWAGDIPLKQVDRGLMSGGTLMMMYIPLLIGKFLLKHL